MIDPDDTSPEAETIRREAQDWVTRLTSGDATADDVEALHRWRSTSRVHRRAFAEANLLWDKLHPAAVDVAGGTVSGFEARVRAAEPSYQRRALLTGAVAAGVAGYLVVRPPLSLWPSLAELDSDYRTGTGQQKQVTLAPGVSVQLNTQTSIALRSPLSDAGDLIELISGEAAIAADPYDRKPFTVIAGKGRSTMDRKARFNLRYDGVTACVTCLEGGIDVDHPGGTRKISANQQVTYTSQVNDPVAAVDPDQVTAWQRGVLIFRDDSLARVIEEVNRYRPGRIVLLNAELARRAVLATFRIDRLDEVVPRLQLVFGLRARTLPGGIVFLS